MYRTVELNPAITATPRNERTVYLNCAPNRYPQAKSGSLSVEYVDPVSRQTKYIVCKSKKAYAAANEFVRSLRK